MILHFKSGHNYLNIGFDWENYNFNIYPDANYIEVSPEDLDRIYKECDFNCFWHMDELTAGHDTTAIEEEAAPF